MKNQIPLCGECGEIVDPETLEGCKCAAESDSNESASQHDIKDQS